MKYGLLYHRTTTNLGDDIQTYAIKQFLPHTDYWVDRENIDKFESQNNEPVATVFAAWWMWKKWNWPPAECIIPKLVSMHFNQYTVDRNASPITNEWMQGVGKQFFDAYGPVGVRDRSSLEFLKEQGIDAYFSGCITLTLPKQKETPDKGKYVVIADLRPELKKQVKNWLSGSGLEIREVTHSTKKFRNNPDISVEERMKDTEELLTLYQNAKFVITRRLHVTLPCLAMEVPVMSIVNMKSKGNSTRWAPYSEWVSFISESDVKKGKIDYDYNNPPANRDTYLPVRNELIRSIKEFIAEMESFGDSPLEQVKKTSYTCDDVKNFRIELMRTTLDNWLGESRQRVKTIKDNEKKIEKYEKRMKAEKELRQSIMYHIKAIVKIILRREV